MSSYAVVTNKTELKNALEREVQKIIITNPDLASNVRILKSSSQAALIAALAAAGVAVTNFWNPIGWTVGLVSAVSGGTIIAAIVVLGLGATLIWAIYNNYSIKTGGKLTLPNGTIVEGEIVLEKN